jgi:hypothetical protein
MDNWGQGTCTLYVSRLYRRAVGVADDRGGFLFGGNCVFEAVFQAVEGDVCQSWGQCPALWSAFFGRKAFSTLSHTRLQPGFDVPPDRGTGVDLSAQRFVINTVEACGSLGIQNPCGLLVDADIHCSHRIPGRASRSQSVTVWCKARFPLWLERHCDHSVQCSVNDCRDTSRPLLVRCRFGYPHPSDGLCLVVES